MNDTISILATATDFVDTLSLFDEEIEQRIAAVKARPCIGVEFEPVKHPNRECDVFSKILACLLQLGLNTQFLGRPGAPIPPGY